MQNLSKNAKPNNVGCYIDDNPLKILSVAHGEIKALVYETNLCKVYPRLVVLIGRQNDALTNILHLVK